MTAPDHLRITGPEDILGFIPHSLGYWPENSLVAMTLQGKRLGATLRVDLPVPGGGSGRSEMLAGFARNVVAYLQADDAADGSLLAFFTDAEAGADTQTDSAGDGHAWADLLKELELALEAAGLPVRDAWIIGTEFWRNADCSDPECCGMPGRPVEQIRNSRLNAEMVYRGSSVGAVPGAQGTTPAPLPVDPAVSLAECGWAEQFSPRRRDRAQFDQVLDVWMMAMQAAIGQEHLPVPTPGAVLGAGTTGSGADAGTAGSGADAGTTGSGTPDSWIIGRPLQLSPELAGYLRASLCIPSWRDAVLVMAAGGRSAAERGAEDFGIFDPDPGSAAFPDNTPAARLRPMPSPLPGPMSGRTSRSKSAPRIPLPVAPGRGGSAAGAGAAAGAVPGYGEVLLGLAPSVPDWTLMGGLERVLERLGRLGDGEATAAAVTARGWIEWCRGRGSYADALYRQALQGHPGYRLAELLAELGRRGTLCGWAARREAAWQKFAPDAA
ncbi:DUF4192 family protein [Arthrobacter sp. NicSoilC12]|uniref:DUF4192 family protein n=1 Tax=Arthrobacter sp. NicSoilC12 TaxID=2831001 RepID=UPI001CC4AE2A|nr:DUF4192 family protein [Arthrobacter sp. NicSoilC12]GIU57600.1 hypothetical protein NicSoilC12_33490 [Arthrobacter sp. NicSoilC12]